MGGGSRESEDEEGFAHGCSLTADHDDADLEWLPCVVAVFCVYGCILPILSSPPFSLPSFTTTPPPFLQLKWDWKGKKRSDSLSLSAPTSSE